MTACANRFPESGSAIVTLVHLTLPSPAFTKVGTYILAWSSRVPFWWLAWSTLIILDVLVISFDFLFVIPSCSIFVCFAGANAASWALISLALTKNPLLTVGEFVLSLFGLHWTASSEVHFYLRIVIHVPLQFCIIFVLTFSLLLALASLSRVNPLVSSVQGNLLWCPLQAGW